MIVQAGYNAREHRNFLKNYYGGGLPGSPAAGALFSVNHQTGDARISGSLASLCGLEKAVLMVNERAIEKSIRKILLMQAHSFFLGGLPMIFYGDEVGYSNDYSYQQDEAKNYDNRWMHRPLIDWKKNRLAQKEGTIEYKIFEGTKKLLGIRRKIALFSDYNNLTWLSPFNIHVAAFVRGNYEKHVFCLFNFSDRDASVTWYLFKEKTAVAKQLVDHYTGQTFTVLNDDDYLVIPPYHFYILEPLKDVQMTV